jgi:hypothetical protein
LENTDKKCNRKHGNASTKPTDCSHDEVIKEKGYESSNTADEAMDSRWVIGSPTYLTVFLKYKS